MVISGVFSSSGVFLISHIGRHSLKKNVFFLLHFIPLPHLDFKDVGMFVSFEGTRYFLGIV